jgi:glycerophosphoryl diester phosphodiesterase
LNTRALHNRHSQDPIRVPLVIGHRGASGLSPENTLTAFRLAMALGADGVEMDVQLSADNQPVVIHDRRVDRTTGGVGPVKRFTANQLAELDAGAWFRRRLALRPRIRAMAEQAAIAADNGRAGLSHDAVPTLAEVLELIAPTRPRRVYIELKTDPTRRQLLLDRTMALVRSSSLADSITLLSFDHEINRLAKVIAPQLRTAATFPMTGRTFATPHGIIKAATKVAADEVALHFGLANRRTVAALHDSGLAVSAWTVNSKILMRRLIAFGVDSIMTNFPNRLIDAIQSPRRPLMFGRRGGESSQSANRK